MPIIFTAARLARVPSNDLPAIGKHWAPLLIAAKMGAISIVGITDPRDRWSPRDIRWSGPTVVILQGDVADARGPDGWRCSMSVIAWARGAMVHGCAGEAKHYALAAGATITHGRYLLAETSGARAMEWMHAIRPRQIPTITLLPAGGQHPLPAATVS